MTFSKTASMFPMATLCGMALAALVVLGTAVRPAQATMLVFTTSDSPFDPGVKNQGWWYPSLSPANNDSNDNYLLGGGYPGTRAFFTFDLSGLNLPALSATLRLTRYSSEDSNERVETIGLFDVTTDAAIVNDNTGTSDAIYDDLGSGVSYGTFDVPGDGDPNDVLEFPLNQAALSDIDAAAGGYFTIGAALLSDDNFDSLFLFSGGPGGVQELVIEVVPEPTTEALLAIGLVLLGGMAFWSKRRSVGGAN